MRAPARPTCADYHAAYRRGAADPLAVAEAALASASESQPRLSAFVSLLREDVMAQAQASAERWRRGAPLGPLDGVLVPIKDAFDVRGYATSDGTTFMGRSGPAARDATLVARLRAAGAIIFGKAALHEIGLGGTGINPYHITARNPYAPDRFTGGSSSGSGAIVAAGLAPLALGSDAGGSIRIPAALCGVYGLKPTYGRIPTTGGALLCWSLDHVGPLGASIEDLALFLDATAGHDAADPATLRAPAYAPIRRLAALEPQALRLAWAPALIEPCQPAIRAAWRLQLEALREAGVTIEEVQLAHGHLHQPVGYVTMASEAAASQSDWLKDHRAKYAPDTRMLLAVGERVSAVEYLRAQQVRRLIADELGELLGRYDGYISPTTGCVAGRISQAAQASGEVNAEINAEVSRFTFLGNLTGFPALSLPAGLVDGLPVGLQIMSRPWSEGRLLAVGAALDKVFEAQRAPQITYNPLERATR